MKVFSSLLIIFTVIYMPLFSQTFYGTGGAIPDDGTPISFTIDVSDLQSPIDTVYGLESICLNIIHTWDSDLEIVLIAPDSSYVLLVSGMGGGDDNFTNTCFNNNSNTSIIHVWAPFTGTYKPIGDLGVVNNGQSGNGTWTLYILDTYAYADAGTLLDWNLTFGPAPSMPFPFTSSDLPIVVINTHGQFIPDEPKLMADMGIIDNGPGQRNYVTDPFNAYNGYIGIERRGSSSQMFPKKAYSLETWDSTGSPVNVALFGMPEESDWLLIANFSDKTLMRNTLTYMLSNKMGDYAPREKFCELMMNGQYWGVYAFMEKIKRDANRVDIAKLEDDDTTGIDLTGGYILKIDRANNTGDASWTSFYPPPVHPYGQTITFVYEYPRFGDMQPQQAAFIQTYVDTFEIALYSHGLGGPYDYKDYMDMGSFIDHFILNELSRNVDGYRLSAFFYKDRGEKLVMGPLWDFDLAWHNADYCEAFNPVGWAYQFGIFCDGDSFQVPFWWAKLLTDTIYENNLKCRWEYLRTTILSEDSLFYLVDSLAAALNESQQRNFMQWPILGIYVWPNPSPIPETYEGEVENLKQWITDRLAWMDDNISGECTTSIQDVWPDNDDLHIFPNPVRDVLTIHMGKNTHSIQLVEIFNSFGQKVKSTDFRVNDTKWGNSSVTIRVDNIEPGSYILKIVTDKGQFFLKVIK
jgi:subtilisin-like proprotein convertase family protein